jgi:hypothetical protein
MRCAAALVSATAYLLGWHVCETRYAGHKATAQFAFAGCVVSGGRHVASALRYQRLKLNLVRCTHLDHRRGTRLGS